MAPLVPTARIFYVYLATAFVLSIATYIYFSTREESERPEGISRGMIGYLKWSGKTGQRAKMYPTLKTGYTNDQETQFFGQV